ncbi:MAG: EthD family reductase [Acidobacteria bacterium]|nr:EthD family reductase [Acidobacteriota bacterium]
MTFKAAILLFRREDATHEQFAQWWLGQHQPLARQLPGLRRAVFNVVQQPGEGDPDGIAELWFDSREAFDAAYASEIGAQVVADSMANVSARRRLFVDEHAVHGG